MNECDRGLVGGWVAGRVTGQPLPYRSRWRSRGCTASYQHSHIIVRGRMAPDSAKVGRCAPPATVVVLVHAPCFRLIYVVLGFPMVEWLWWRT